MIPVPLSVLVIDAHGRAVRKGWWEDEMVPVLDPNRGPGLALDADLVEQVIPEKLALLHSEISEALECFRNGEMTVTIGKDGKPEGFPVELADLIIRSFDLAGALKIDLDAVVRLKSEYNETRPHRHGGKRC